jgi:hypothetical protein
MSLSLGYTSVSEGIISVCRANNNRKMDLNILGNFLLQFASEVYVTVRLSVVPACLPLYLSVLLSVSPLSLSLSVSLPFFCQFFSLSACLCICSAEETELTVIGKLLFVCSNRQSEIGSR